MLKFLTKWRLRPRWFLLTSAIGAAFFTQQTCLAVGKDSFFLSFLGALIGIIVSCFFWFEEIKEEKLPSASFIPILGLFSSAVLCVFLPRNLLPIADPLGLHKYLLGGGWVFFLLGTIFFKSFSFLAIQKSLKARRLFVILFVFLVMLGFWVGITPLAGDEGPHISWSLAFARNIDVNLDAIASGEFPEWSNAHLSDPFVPGLMNETVGAQRSKWLSLMDPLNVPLAMIALKSNLTEYGIRRLLALSSIVLFALGMTLIHWTLTGMGLSSRKSGVLLLLLTASCSIQLWGNAILPEAWGFCLTAGLVLLTITPSSGWKNPLGAFLLALYPWLHIRYLPIMGVVILIWFWFSRKELRRPSLWFVGISPTISTLGRFVFNAWLTGQTAGAYGADASGAYVSFLRVPLQYAGYWFDADYGLMVNIPLLFVGAGGLYASLVLRKGADADVKKILPFLIGFLIQGILLSPYNLWHGDGGFGRFILVYLPLLFPIFILINSQNEKQFSRWCFWAALPGFLLNGIYSSVILIFRMTPHDPLGLGYLLPQTIMWQAYSPEIILSHWPSVATGTTIVVLQLFFWGGVSFWIVRKLGGQFKTD